MKTTIHHKDLIELSKERVFTDNFQLNGNYLIESHNIINIHGIHINDFEYQLNGVLLTHRQWNLEQQLEMQVKHDFPFLKMHFEYEGHSTYARNSQGSLNADIPSGTHRLMFFPEVKGTLTYPKTKRYSLEILVSIEFFQKIFNYDTESVGKFGKSIEVLSPSMLHPKELPITAEMKQIIFAIINCPLEKGFKRIFLESKVIELLILQLTQVKENNHLLCESVLRKDDREKIYEAKEILEKQIENPCSLLQLSEMVGINDFKLKKGFKEVFGTTVFNYLSDFRMQKAKDMILENRQTIAEIAYEIGFKNPQHFTAAFKRKYGYLPSVLKNNRIN
ncbi:helix-turn-helix domain-containing protein [Rhizosphaericola mali]|uniref:Helix-turn-helix transcriptional regulator n=1 Tax=Rhizosphaericola mali TaxID=2545455 RepID=A0A5P2FX61_9BACT|nr:AraC family transcriptional regulator [Rhizosphaericola mali]QES87507.1 helix-turn-helix transcriptional regulator [Rhizosphaericola mali]